MPLSAELRAVARRKAGKRLKSAWKLKSPRCGAELAHDLAEAQDWFRPAKRDWPIRATWLRHVGGGFSALPTVGDAADLHRVRSGFPGYGKVMEKFGGPLPGSNACAPVGFAPLERSVIDFLAMRAGAT